MKQIAKILQSRTIKDSGIVFLGLAVTAVLGFIYTVLMARLLRPESFGVFSAVVSLLAIVYSLGDLGVGPAIINFLPKIKDGGGKLISSTFWLQFSAGFLLATSFWYLAKYSNHFIPGSLSEHFILVGSLVFNYMLIGWSQSIFTAQKNFSYLSGSQIIDAVIKIAIVLLLFKIGKLSITTALLANFISTTFAFLITFWRQLLTISLTFHLSTISGVYHYSKWVALSRLFSVFFSRIDIILLNILASSFSAGIFAAASRVTLLFAMIVSSLGSVVNPRFSVFKTKSETTLYIKKLFFLITSVSLCVLAGVVFAKPIILTVFGVRFADSIAVFQWLSLSMIPFLYSVIFTASILYTFHQPKFYAFTTFLQFAIVLIINLIFIPKIGYYAPVIASAISNTLVFLLSALKLRRLLVTLK